MSRPASPAARLPEGPGGSGPAAGGPRPRRHRRRITAVEPLRAERPRARRPALPLQAGLARRPARATPRPGSPRTRAPARADGRLQHRPDSTPTWATRRSFPASPPTSPQPERDGVQRVRAMPGSATSCARSCRRATPTGTTSSCASRATRACASTSSSARDAFADLVTDAAIHRNERKGDAPSDHVPVVVDLDLDRWTTTIAR